MAFSEKDLFYVLIKAKQARLVPVAGFSLVALTVILSAGVLVCSGVPSAEATFPGINGSSI